MSFKGSKVMFFCTCLLTFIGLFSGSVHASGNVYGADSTAYSAKSGALTHSGKDARWGYVAVHYRNGKPMRPFGTIIMPDKSVYHPLYGSRGTFYVEDTGDYGNVFDAWWIDFYFGDCSTCSKYDGTYDNYDRAVNYGTRTINYYYYTP